MQKKRDGGGELTTPRVLWLVVCQIVPTDCMHLHRSTAVHLIYTPLSIRSHRKTMKIMKTYTPKQNRPSTGASTHRAASTELWRGARPGWAGPRARGKDEHGGPGRLGAAEQNWRHWRHLEGEDDGEGRAP